MNIQNYKVTYSFQGKRVRVVIHNASNEVNDSRVFDSISEAVKYVDRVTGRSD